MEVFALVVFLAALYGVRSGYVGAKQTARKALKDWSEGTRPESTWGRRAGMATGAFGWAAFQGARGFKNSFGPGFWEGAQKAAAWAEQRKVLRTAPAQRIGRHADTKLTKRAKKVSIEKPQRVRFDDEPPKRQVFPPVRPVPCRCGCGKSGNRSDVLGRPVEGEWIDDACETRQFKEAIEKVASTTPAPTTGGTTVASETTVQSIRTYLEALTAEFTAVADDAGGGSTRAGSYYTTATTEVDGATQAGFKDDITGPLATVADALHAYQTAMDAAKIAAEAVLAGVTQANAEIGKHSTLTDAATGLSGGVNSMADSSAYQDA